MFSEKNKGMDFMPHIGCYQWCSKKSLYPASTTQKVGCD